MYIMMDFKCDDPNTIIQFNDRLLNKVFELAKVIYEKKSQNIWSFYFYLRKFAPIAEAVKSICKIATEFNLEFDEEYSVYEE